MAWRFRKRVKLIPGVYLNFSKKGISTTVGIKGASVNFGKNGTYLNTGIPGTGLYNRQKISASSQTRLNLPNNSMAVMNCPNCKKPQPNGYTSCGWCGYSLQSIETKPATTAQSRKDKIIFQYVGLPLVLLGCLAFFGINILQNLRPTSQSTSNALETPVRPSETPITLRFDPKSRAEFDKKHPMVGMPVAIDSGSNNASTSGSKLPSYLTGTVSVNGYFRKNGTYVHSYTRRR